VSTVVDAAKCAEIVPRKEAAPAPETKPEAAVA